MKHAVMSLSGGMDSTSLLIRLLRDGYQVSCYTYDYGQKHSIEIERAVNNIEYLKSCDINVNHHIIDIKAAMQSFDSALLDETLIIPEGHYESIQMKSTVVPNRNAIFSSILYGHALSVSSKFNCDVIVGLGVHSGDHEIYPDCRPEFYSALDIAFKLGNWGSERISFHLPYLGGNKKTILLDALNSCKELDLEFDIIFKNTNTSYNPDLQGRSSGKSGADIERILAFYEIGRKDPVEYTKDWNEVLNNALMIKKEHDDLNE